VRDAFVGLLREFGDASATLQFGAKPTQSIEERVHDFFSMLWPQNYYWFAQLFEYHILQSSTANTLETDPSLIKLVDPEKLRKLHRRFSPQVSIASSSNSSSTIESFFFKFLEIGNNYHFNMHLKSTLAAKLLLLAQPFALSQRKTALLRKNFNTTMKQLLTLSKVPLAV
jgi:hypothetical protein